MPSHRCSLPAVVALLLQPLCLPTSACHAGGGGELELRAVDADSGNPIAVRMHLKDARGKSVKPPKLPYWNDHFAFFGKTILELPPGRYTFEMERGPEYKIWTGSFELKRADADNETVEMHRFIDMAKDGWYSGDLLIDRPAKDIELLMLADDLHVAPLVAWSNSTGPALGKPSAKASTAKKTAIDEFDGAKPKAGDAANGAEQNKVICFDKNRFYAAAAGRDDRAGGPLLLFNLAESLKQDDPQPEFPSAVELLKKARGQEGKHADAARPFAWDLPVWAASGMLDSVSIACDHSQRDGMQSPTLGRPADRDLYSSGTATGKYSLDVYFHLLNCGLRLPPSAGSGSGLAPNPLGYNRVYVHCDGELTWDAWWQNLKAGQVVITNGPLMQPSVNGKLPGHVFEAPAGEEVELSIALNLSTREKIDYLEIIQDGRKVQEVRLDQWAKAGGMLPPVKFTQSGWCVVRARTTNQQTYRFAMTGPYYVEIGEQPRISKASAQYFVDWIDQRTKQIKLADPAQQAEVLKYQRAARDFWQRKVDGANAD